MGFSFQKVKNRHSEWKTDEFDVNSHIIVHIAIKNDLEVKPESRKVAE